jgi:acyl-CoA synthetase (AMP-forming)/AMP-acid ligase II
MTDGTDATGPLPTIDELLDMMLARIDAHPDGVAIVEPHARWQRWLGIGARSIGRREVARRVRAVRAGLRRLGMLPGDVVLYAVRPGIDSIVLMAALLLVGANVVALDPGVGQQLFDERLKALTPTWVVAESIVFAATAPGLLRRLLRGLGVEVPNIHVERATFIRVGWRWPGVPRSVACADLCAGDPAQLSGTASPSAERIVLTVFTSGTTSAPKAVLHSAKSLGASVAIIARHMALGDSDVLYSSQTHQMLAGLLAGSTCVAPPLRPDARRFIADVNRYQASHAYAVPFEMAGVVRELERVGATLPAHLATIVLGSAPILSRFLIRLRAVSGPGTDIWCAYAMTELFPVALIESRDKLSYAGDGDLVGTPVEGVHATVAADGELLVSGPHLFARYLGHAPTLVHDTGDLARLDPAGRIVLLGRKKDMIIRGHYNIYPSLYEPGIAAIEGIEACALVGVADEEGCDERVVLAVQPQAGVDAAALRRRVEREVREGAGAIDPFARPDAVVICTLPHSGRSSKLDRSRLAALAAEEIGRAGR